jgi:hypothetical protein
VGNKNCADRVGINTKLAHRDHGGRATIDQKVAGGARDPKAGIEAAARSKRIARSDECQFQGRLLAEPTSWREGLRLSIFGEK